MTKKMGCLLVVVVIGAIGSWSIRQATERYDKMSPEERTAVDSRQQAASDSTRRHLERTPGYQKGLAEFALKQRMKDPDAAQFRNERMYTRGDTLVVCGEVNAKNGFGGYTGFKGFVALRGAVVTEEDARTMGAKFVNYMFSLCENRSPK